MQGLMLAEITTTPYQAPHKPLLTLYFTQHAGHSQHGPLPQQRSDGQGCGVHGVPFSWHFEGAGAALMLATSFCIFMVCTDQLAFRRSTCGFDAANLTLHRNGLVGYSASKRTWPTHLLLPWCCVQVWPVPLIYGVYMVLLAGALIEYTAIYGVYIYIGLTKTIRTYIRIYGIYTVFLAGKLPYIWSYTVYVYGIGQPYIHGSGRP